MKWLAVLSLLFSVAHAEPQPFDAQMAPVLESYLKIHAALFTGATEPVGPAAQALGEAAARLDPKALEGAQASALAGLPEKLKTASEALAKAPDLKAQREAFKALSQPVALWVSLARPPGYAAAYCPMVKASWVQGRAKDAPIANPYAPETMPRCGDFVGGEGSAPKAP